MYRQTLTGHDLSVEEGTENVPNDGFYYVFLQGVQKGRFRTLKLAIKTYESLKNTLNLPPRSNTPPPPLAEILRREMETQSNKSLIWEQEDFIRVQKSTGRRGRVR